MAKVVTAHQWSTAWNRTLERLDLLTRGAPPPPGRQRTRIKRIEALTGRVHAEIQDQTQGNCQVTLRFAPLTEQAWHKVIESLENQLQTNGQRNVEELFHEPAPFFTELSNLLLPGQQDELQITCSCAGASPNSCPACELVYRQVGTMLDEEPILLLRLRGREWQTLQQALQARRKADYLGGLPAAGMAVNGANGAAATAGQASAPPHEKSLEQALDHFWGSRKVLEALHYHIASPLIELALLRRLGPLPAMLDEQSGRALAEAELAQEMAKIYRQVTSEAQSLAYSLDTPEAGNRATPNDIEPK
ncbi:MAG: hypothetical protein KF832_18355 [Caldilineaceae bacterium]|nr:hypothetical protein [Caldilineaceae bacterium]